MDKIEKMLVLRGSTRPHGLPVTFAARHRGSPVSVISASVGSRVTQLVQAFAADTLVYTTHIGLNSSG